MTGELSGCGADELKSMLRNLEREEIIEVLSDVFCQHCNSDMQSRINNIVNKKLSKLPVSNGDSSELFWDADSSSQSSNRSASWGSARTPESLYSREKEKNGHFSPPSVNNKHLSNKSDSSKFNGTVDNELSVEQKEYLRFKQVVRKKDFVHYEKIDGRSVNVVKGLELHTGVFSTEEQNKIVECVYDLQRMGQKGQLRERTYSEPRKWMRGKGRITMQFGCCYNYALDKNGNPPGIIRDEDVDPLPPQFKQMISRMVRWHVLPLTCVPNSCIVNIYDEGDCIPPHIDHHDFLRPFCTVSFLTECNILFGSNLQILNPGEFSGPVSIPLPVGSVLILNGNGADIAKHCVPGVPSKRISITFRRMDERKLPYNFKQDPELRGLKPLLSTPQAKNLVQQQNIDENKTITRQRTANTSNSSYVVAKDDFPPLGSIKSANKRRSR
jgi:alkylated DNA repair protein alkB family protein 5